MKRVFYVLSLLFTAVAVHAENAFSIASLEIQPGEEKTISVVLTNDEDAQTAAIDITLPTGLSFVNGDTAGTVVFSDRTSGMPSKSAKIQTNGALRIGMAFGVVSAGSGELFTFKVNAADDATLGSYKIKYSAMALTLATSGKTVLSDMESDVTVYKTCKVDIQTANYTGGSVTINKGAVGDNVEFGAEIEVQATANEGYHFVKWSNGETSNPYSFIVGENLDLTAEFAPNQYTVAFTADGAMLSSEKLDYGTAIVAPTAPEKEGYTFNGWNPELTEGTTVPAHDVTYDAVYSVNSYYVIYMVNDVEWTRVNLDYGATISLLEYQQNEGEGFSGWSYSDGNTYTTMPSHDLIVVGTVTTGINEILKDESAVNVYDVNGQLVLPTAKSLDKLPKGIYIVKGRKIKK